MIVLGSNTEVLRARLSAAATTTNPTFLFNYGDDNGKPVLGRNPGTFDDTTNVDLVGSPDTGVQRAIRSGLIYNGDAAAATVIIEHYDGTTATQLCKIAIVSGGTLTYGSNGFAVGGGAVGDMTKAVYDDAGIAEQLVGLTATQTLTNKDLSDDTNTFPTFNQDTTGSAAKLTTARKINGKSFDGSADIVAPQSPVTALSISSGVVAVDCSLGNYFTLSLTANVTSITFSNVPASGYAQSIMIRMQQDATGSRTVALPSSFEAIDGSDTAVQSAASAYTIIAATTFDQGTRWEYSMKAGA
jgi:hypothetical protein